MSFQFFVGIAAADADLWGDARRPVSRLGGTPGPARAARIVDVDVAMSEESTGGAESALRSLADKVNWLIDRARPGGRGSCSNAEVADLIERATGERVSYTTIWKLRNEQATNPQKRLIEAMARTFGVRPAFFFGDHDVNQAGLVQEEVEMLAMIRDARITADQLRPFLRLSPEARQLIIGFVTVVARDEARRRAGQGEDA